jgi:hypothetical protein
MALAFVLISGSSFYHFSKLNNFLVNLFPFQDEIYILKLIKLPIIIHGLTFGTNGWWTNKMTSII